MSEISEKIEKGLRLKLRFNTTQGVINIEDLYDLSLINNGRINKTSLDDIARQVNKELIEKGTESFVTDSPGGDEILQLKLDIVKHVIAVKKAELAAANEAVINRNRRQLIDTIIERKQTEELMSLPLEELQKMR